MTRKKIIKLIIQNEIKLYVYKINLIAKKDKLIRFVFKKINNVINAFKN